MTPLYPTFCRNCGSQSSAANLTSCEVCGASLVAEPPPPSLIGATVSFDKVLGHSTGIVLEEDPGKRGQLVVADGGKVRTVRRSAMKGDPAVPNNSPSTAYRLHVASKGNIFRDHFDSTGDSVLGPVVERRNELLADLNEARAFAASAILDGDYEVIEHLRVLSDLERSWAAMWAAHNRFALLGDSQAPEVALQFFLRLPVDCYPDKLCVAIANWPTFSALPDAVELLRRAATALHPLPLAQATALLLAASENDATSVDVHDLLQGLASQAVPGVRWTDSAEALDALRRTADSLVAGDLELDLADLAQLPLAVLDELIDQGRLTGDHARQFREMGSQHAAYLIARTDPTSLTQAELREAKHVVEDARRALNDGRSVPEEAPESYKILAAARNGDAAALGVLAEDATSPNRVTARALLATLTTGTVDESVTCDRSTWPLIANQLRALDAGRANDSTVKSAVHWSLLESARQCLYEWNWSGAVRAARECLRTARDEDVRDEALNYLAVAQMYLGNPDAALDALEAALEGVDSPELIINYGVIAGERRRVEASKTLGRLALEAPTLALRVTAARRALTVWQARRPGEDSDENPPEELVIAMRALAVEATGLDEHVAIMRFLAWADDEWLADERHTAGSPYSSTVAHRYLVAYASSIDDGQEVLVRHNAKTPDDPFVVEEAQSLARMLIGALFEGDVWRVGLGAWALDLASSGLPLEPRQGFLLRVLGVREITGHLANDDFALPKETVFDNLVEAKAMINTLATEDRDDLVEFLDETFTRYARLCMIGWAREHDQVVDAYNEVIANTRFRIGYRVNWAAVGQFGRAMVEALDDIDRYAYAVVCELKDRETAEDLGEFRKQVAHLRALVRQGTRI